MQFNEEILDEILMVWDMANDDDHHKMRQGRQSLISNFPQTISLSAFYILLDKLPELNVTLPLAHEISFLENEHGEVLVPISVGFALIFEMAQADLDEEESESSHYFLDSNPGIRFLAAATTRGNDGFEILVNDPCVLVRCMVAAASGNETSWYLEQLMDDPNGGLRKLLKDLFQINNSFSSDTSEISNTNNQKLSDCSCNDANIEEINMSTSDTFITDIGRFVRLKDPRAPWILDGYVPHFRQLKEGVWGTQPFNSFRGQEHRMEEILTGYVPDHFFFDYSHDTSMYPTVTFSMAFGDIAIYFRKHYKDADGYDPKDHYDDYLYCLDELIKNIPGTFSMEYKKRRFILASGFAPGSFDHGDLDSFDTNDPIIFARIDDKLNNGWELLDCGSTWEDVHEFFHDIWYPNEDKKNSEILTCLYTGGYGNPENKLGFALISDGKNVEMALPESRNEVYKNDVEAAITSRVVAYFDRTWNEKPFETSARDILEFMTYNWAMLIELSEPQSSWEEAKSELIKTLQSEAGNPEYVPTFYKIESKRLEEIDLRNKRRFQPDNPELPVDLACWCDPDENQSYMLFYNCDEGTFYRLEGQWIKKYKSDDWDFDLEGLITIYVLPTFIEVYDRAEAKNEVLPISEVIKFQSIELE